MTNRFNKLIKLAFLLLGIIFSLVNCEKTENLSHEITESKPLSSESLKIVSITDIDVLKPIIKNINSLEDNLSKYNTTIKQGLENIALNQIVQYTNETGFSTYTLIIEKSLESINFENLHLTETQKGYIAYILSYEPDPNWYNKILESKGYFSFDIASFEGHITKYSLEREVIWTTKGELINEKTSKSNQTAKGSTGGYFVQVCITTIEPQCNYGGSLHTWGDNCTGDKSNKKTESCRIVWTNNILSPQNNPDYEGDGGGGGSTTNGTYCSNTSGTSIIGSQPISGISSDCSPNTTIGGPISSSYQAFWMSLSPGQQNFLNQNQSILNNVLSFLNINKYNAHSLQFIKSAIELDMILFDKRTVLNTNKIPSELDSCCPGDCCPDMSLYNKDRIVYEYGIQPIVAFIDGSFNLLLGTSELIGSDAWVGSRIRKMMLEIGIDVPTDINNEHLSKLYRIRKRDNVVIVEYRPGLLKSMLDVGLDTVDVLAFLSPAKGGGPVLFSKIGGNISITSLSNHIRDITVTSVKIDKAVNNLKSKAKFVMDGTGEFKNVGGHHPLAKIAFSSDKFYDLQKAFSVSQNTLEIAWKSANSGIPLNLHQQITGNQNRLYSTFAKTNQVLTIEKMADLEIQALIDAKIPKDIAIGWVIKALEDLKAQGVKVITNIPWNGLN